MYGTSFPTSPRPFQVGLRLVSWLWLVHIRLEIGAKGVQNGLNVLDSRDYSYKMKDDRRRESGLVSLIREKPTVMMTYSLQKIVLSYRS